MNVDPAATAAELARPIRRLLALAAAKVRSIDRSWVPAKGSPVFTVNGRYTARGWTEWTQGFQFGSIILAGDATGDDKLIQLGKRRTIKYMLPHVSHVGVHDHGFNTMSTYGNLLRLLKEKRMPYDGWEEVVYRNAICVSGAVQAARWSALPDGLGYIYSFNGPHSLFVDTMRTLRVMSAAWKLGHALMHEGDRKADLLKRAVFHALATSHHIIFHGDSDHTYDVPGRTAHEAIFNRKDGAFRSRATQQGYSPFSTWTRGLAWAMLGYAEQLEFFKTVTPARFKAACGLAKSKVVRDFERCARQTCDHYLRDVTAADGIPYWDDGAPGLAKLGDWRSVPADPYNDHEPVDSSAAAIAAQGLLRFGTYLGSRGKRYTQAGLTVARTLMSEPYLSTNKRHQGLLLHSVYHRPNGWDHIPRGRKIPCGESSMWGDYHLLELANLIQRKIERKPDPAFFKI